MSDKQPRLPKAHLTFVIRNDAPLFLLEEPVTHRFVQIELTEAQREKLKLHYTGMSSGNELFEEISSIHEGAVER